jgi:D-proline reductase (dithiol) PrdB
MCHQSVGLVQSLIEKSGIATVSITLLPEVTRRVKPPRALSVERPLGYPFGEPDNPVVQTRILLASLRLMRVSVDVPLIESWSSPS